MTAVKRVSDSAGEIKTRFGVEVHAADGSDETKKAAILAAAEVVPVASVPASAC